MSEEVVDPQNEEEDASIEDILDSIRQIISDDDEEEGDDAVTPEQVDETEPEAAESDDPVGDIFDEAPAEASSDDIDDIFVADEPAPAPEPEELEDDVIDLVDRVEPEPEAESEPEAHPIISEDEIIDDAVDELLSGDTKAAALGGFETLVKKTAIVHNGITIEDIVRTELRPLLKGWLDDNLPSMIERLVQEELEQLAKRALGED